MVEICPQCQTLWLFEEKDVGRRVACPKCAALLEVHRRTLAESARILRAHDQQRKTTLPDAPGVE